MRFKTNIILLLLVVLCILSCSCGATDTDALGRYVEEEVVLPDSQNSLISLVQAQRTLRLVDLYGEDLISTDGGENFEVAELIPAAYRNKNTSFVSSVTGAPDGSRILVEYVDGICICELITAEGEKLLLENLCSEGYPYVYYGTGYFYMCVGCEIYQIDSTNGEIMFLTECAFFPLYLVANENMLFIVHTDGVLLYDLQKKTVAEKQDEVLSSFFSGRIESPVDGTSSVLLYPYVEKIYVLTKSGLFSYELYGGEMECIIDGSMYRISDIDMEFAGMAVLKEDESKESFYVYFSDGTLMCYANDETLPAEPEISLRIYSLYEDGNITQAVSAFRQKYPEMNIKYEVGVNPDYGVTEEDALRNLSTELATCTGPDIFVMDDISYESYVEKGVLEDLNPIRDEMSEEYFGKVIDGFSTDEGLYVIPLTFAVPVLAGETERFGEIGEIENLSQLAEVIEKTDVEQEGSIIGFRTAEEALRLFAQSSMGAWTMEDGTINCEALEEFLTQVKRIYDIQMKELPEGVQDWSFSGLNWGRGENVLARRLGSYGVSESLSVGVMCFPEQPFYAGYLTSALEDYPLTNGKLVYSEGEYVLMPGQNYGTCLPATLMAINSASEHKEESRLFLKYVLSLEFQGNVSLNGTPVNKEAYLCRQINPKGNSDGVYAHYAYNEPDGTMISMEIYWPTEEDFAKLDNLMESISGVNYCDNRIYKTVMEIGQAAITGETGIEETVDAIGEELELYLAE